MAVRKSPPSLGVSTSISSATAGSQVVTAVVPVGSTVNFVLNGATLGAATVSPLGVASYGPVTLRAEDRYFFSGSAPFVTPTGVVPGKAPVYVPPPDPAIAASSAQASSRASEVSAAANDTSRPGNGAGPFTALARPTISGKPLVGQTLIGYPGLWDASAGLTYAWSIGGTTASEKSRRYVVQAADAGQAIVFTVTPNSGTPSSAQAITAYAAAPTLQLEDGTDLLLEDGTPFLLDDRRVQWLAPFSASQSTADQLADPKITGYTHAVNDADIFVASSTLPISLYAPGSKIVNIWHSGAVQLALVPDSDGYVQGILPLTGLANGALIIEAHALIDGTNESLSQSGVYAQITVILRGGSAPSIPAIPTGAQGLTLAFNDEFTDALSVSNANSRPAGVKWFGSQALDPNGYGDAIFAPPGGAQGQTTIIDGMLRMRDLYDPTNAAKLNDPYGRKWIGVCLTSSFPDGSTSLPSMGDGYYECRMLCPIGIGTWPAFWLNDQSALLKQAAGNKTPYGREIDIVEQYNLNNGYSATQHRYQPDSSGKNVDLSTGFTCAPDKGKMGWAWRRFGARVDSVGNKIIYYLDDQVVATDNSYFKPAGEDNPTLNHIILTAALNGGWPVAVPPSGYYDTYVDYVRYWK